MEYSSHGRQSIIEPEEKALDAPWFKIAGAFVGMVAVAAVLGKLSENAVKNLKTSQTQK